LVRKGVACVSEQIAVRDQRFLNRVLDVVGGDELGEEAGEEAEVTHPKPIQKEVPPALQIGGVLEQIADLAEVERVQDDVVGLLGAVVTLDLGEHDEQQHDGREDIPEHLHIAQSVIQVAG